jgi:ribosomal protein S18 acetylase RimI-like enzyme
MPTDDEPPSHAPPFPDLIAEPVCRPHGHALIRPARPADAPAAWTIEAAVFNETERFSLRQTAALIANPRARVFVAESADRVVAWIAMLTRRSRSGTTGRLYTLAVAPDQAGRGLGRRLATHAVDRLEAEGVTRIYLEVRADNDPAIALYESMRFRTVQHLPGYYAPHTPALRMLRSNPHHAPGA